MKRGIVIVFSGDGKGKTSAATGCAIRMLGWGKKVVYCTFFKNKSGEFKILKNMKNCKLLMFCRKYPIYASASEKREFQTHFIDEWNKFLKTFHSIKKCDLIVMDEILIAVRDKILTEHDIISFIDAARNRIPKINIILTGRGTTRLINKRADIVTNMCCVKHPYPDIVAQKGIEY
ncbi:MAG TPA: cob(I)yrinic acid a,c-diamide adenosyltransferase [bacterium]|nr:cob(I)yrinic acid a,c-diamide adenosyltransferase [bacterium]HOL49240.1 cob(I)yrinic acid a,c-diamide adenosyltransferase [bacterium]HPO52186.1 cob(I)yrinic acid a,c-diamide adenosyltransferase [bacterium]